MVVFLRDDVVDGRALAPSGSTLARRFDAQDDEAVVAREHLLAEELGVLAGRRDERRGDAEALGGVAGRPAGTVGLEVALAVLAGAVPHDLLRPDDVVEHVAAVEAQDVVVARRHELAAHPEDVVPRAEQYLTLRRNKNFFLRNKNLIFFKKLEFDFKQFAYHCNDT